MEVLVVIIGILATSIFPVLLYLVVNEAGTRKAVERRRQGREGLLTRLDFLEVELRTGYPVPQPLKAFYASPAFLDLDGFHFMGACYSSGRAQLFWLDHFLPLNGEMLDQCKLLDPTWLPFAQDERGAILFLPLSEFHAGDGPVYRIDQSPPPWKKGDAENLRRVSDSLSRILEQGARGAVRE
jgi:hypothetical protein